MARCEVSFERSAASVDDDSVLFMRHLWLMFALAGVFDLGSP